MTEANEPIIPQQAQDLLNQEAEKNHDSGKKRIFIGIPTMGNLNVGLWLALLNWAQNQKQYELWFNFAVEQRPIDYARNVLVTEFLKTKCDYMAMLDEDVSPHPNFLTLVDHDKDIIAANTHCWIGQKLIPSIWQNAECEQCRNLKVWMEEGKIHDTREYYSEGGMLYRWDPLRQVYSRFANKSGILGGMKCRCRGTGMDPWVFRQFQKPFEPGKIINCDSVGSASMIVRRNVIETLKPPHFQFLYRPLRDILMTEDHFFCWVAGVHGFKVWADLDMICSHYKTVDLSGVNMRLIDAFNAGMGYQQKQSDVLTSGIIIPTDADVKKVDSSRIEEKKLVIS